MTGGAYLNLREVVTRLSGVFTDAGWILEVGRVFGEAGHDFLDLYAPGDTDRSLRLSKIGATPWRVSNRAGEEIGAWVDLDDALAALLVAARIQTSERG